MSSSESISVVIVSILLNIPKIVSLENHLYLQVATFIIFGIILSKLINFNWIPGSGWWPEKSQVGSQYPLPDHPPSLHHLHHPNLCSRNSQLQNCERSECFTLNKSLSQPKSWWLDNLESLMNDEQMHYELMLPGSQCIQMSRHKPDLSLYRVMMTIVAVFIMTNLPRTSLTLYEVTTLPGIIKCLKFRCGWVSFKVGPLKGRFQKKNNRIFLFKREAGDSMEKYAFFQKLRRE